MATYLSGYALRLALYCVVQNERNLHLQFGIYIVVSCHWRTASALGWLPVTLLVYPGSRSETEKLLWNAH